MLQVRNETPFVAELFLFPDAQGVETTYVTVKATFELRGGRPEVAEKQIPLCLADEYWGEPGQSGLKYANEAHLCRPGTDVALIGEALAPYGRPADTCQVSLQVGHLHKSIQVFGDRVWRGGLLSPRPSSPEPFVTMPLVYERAFGGTHAEESHADTVLAEPRNPVGTGFRGRRSTSEMMGMRLPNLEDPQHLIRSISDTPSPMGVGFIAPGWEPRQLLAGTYGEAWRKTRAPYLPLDFRPEFYQVASPGLHSPSGLKGGEPVEWVNVSPDGTLRFPLPACRFDVAVRLGRALEHPVLALERVLLEPGERWLCLLWRAAVRCDKRVLKVHEVCVRLRSLGKAGGES